MDSRLLAEAYSKRYKYIEQEHIEKLKSNSVPEKLDVLARARRLSQETNRRRKQQAQKRRIEAAREEKRRQEILDRRHQEQQQATEKYQRSHVGSKPQVRFLSSHYVHGSLQRAEIDNVLRLVTGGSPNTIHLNQSLSGTPFSFHLQQNTTQDPLERLYVKNGQGDRASSARHDSYHKRAGRPQSGVQHDLDALSRAEMLERSMRNLMSSRSHFENHLEQHQQFLLQQQQKSLQEFNQAIRQEIDNDINVQGMGDKDGDSPDDCESLSSLDSLEEPVQLSRFSESQLQLAQPGCEPSKHQADAAGPPRIYRKKVQNKQTERKQQEASKGQMSNSRNGDAALNTRDVGHSVGADSEGSRLSAKNQQSDPAAGQSGGHQSAAEGPISMAERVVAVGTALCLPQQPEVSVANQVVKQPAPPLQYSSQLLSHRRFEPRGGNTAGGNAPQAPGRRVYSAGRADEPHVQETFSAAAPNAGTNPGALVHFGASIQDCSLAQADRPKSHTYAWTSPLPSEQDQNRGLSSAITSSSNSIPSSNPPIFAANVAEDRVMATNISPHTAHSMGTAATVTWIYTSVNTNQNKDPVYSQATLYQSTVTTHQSSRSSIFSESLISGNVRKGVDVSVDPAVAYMASAALKSVPGLPSQYLSESKQVSMGDSGKENRAPAQGQEDSIARETLGLKNRHTAMLEEDMSGDEPDKTKVVVAGDRASSGNKEVRSILKSSGKTRPSTAMPQTKFNVHDSIEVTRKHLLSDGDFEQKKVKKKAVRFADLSYEEEVVDEDSDSEDSLTEVSQMMSAIKQSQDDSQIGSAPNEKQKNVRPASAKVGFSEASSTRALRTASARPFRSPAAVRPKAAAHIIMSSEASSHIGDGATSGITVHKSQLERKVTLVNNNFMSRIPAFTTLKANSTIPGSFAADGNNPAHLVYTVAQAKNSEGDASVPMEGEGLQKTGLVRTASANGSVQSPPVNGVRVPAAKSVSSMLLPSHSHFSNSGTKAVYSDTGLRIDRTPTDEEINSLWMNMRTMLDRGDKMQAPAVTQTTSPASFNISNNNNDHHTENRPTVQLSNKYIDGAFLANSASVRPTFVPAANFNGNMVTGQLKAGGQPKNGYYQRYSLLQQRRSPSAIGTGTRAKHVVEQTLHSVPVSSNNVDARQTTTTAAAVGYLPGEEVSESMAGFLAAEQVLQTHGPGVSDSRIMAAISSAQTQQDVYNSIRHKVTQGGPSALSLEEQRVMDSIDRLNDRLRVIDNREPDNQQVNAGLPATHQVYVHSAGFRGHQLTSRGGISSQRMAGRPFSSRLLNRQHN